MSTEQQYRLRVEASLAAASETQNMKRRSELIDEAVRWHTLAMAQQPSAIDWGDEALLDGLLPSS